MKKIFVISVFASPIARRVRACIKNILFFTMLIGLLGVLSACAFFYPLEVYNTVQQLRNATNQESANAIFVTISSPISNITISNTSCYIAGSANANNEIKTVYLSLNDTQYKKVNGTISWNTNITTLIEGNNNITVYAEDNVGNKSETKSVLIIVNTGAPAITIFPSGDITTNEAFTATLSVGENYGYWSTNSSIFMQFTTAGTSVDISNDVELLCYGADVTGNISSTQMINYTFDYGQIYVSTSGDDSKDGKAPFKPVLSIQRGVEQAISANYDKVYVEAGTYIQGAGLSNTVEANNYAGVNINNANNINLVGGWNSGFTTHTEYSVLNGANGATSNKHIIWVQNTTNLTIEGFVIRDGNADAGSNPHRLGGGIYFDNTSYTLITNCIISNNIANNYGGGGVYIYNSSYNNISGTISDNSAVDGGGVFINNSSYNNISGTISDNTGYCGGGVYVNGGSYNNISGTIYGNIADDNGGGMYIHYGSNNTISGTVYGNTGVNGGGVYIDSGSNNTISGTIYGNIATQNGGGFYLENSDNNIFTNGCIITNNTCGSGYNGGGVYEDSASTGNTTNGALIDDNTGNGDNEDNWYRP